MKHYSEFPSNYEKILDHFSQKPTEPVNISLPGRIAVSTRRDIYRYKEALSFAEDERGKQLYEVIKSLTFSVEPPDAKGDEEAELIIKPDSVGFKMKEVFGGQL